MFAVLEILTVTLVAIAMAMSLSHALEFPGKLRLDKQTYYAVQPIYYPGFTIGGGVGEFGGTIAIIVLLVLTPTGTTRFWLTVVALLGLVGMQGVYWLFTHPVNGFWLKHQKLDRFSSGFFSFGTAKVSFGTTSKALGSASEDKDRKEPPWTTLRNRWEYSHVARASLGLLSLIALVIAIASDS